MAIELTSPRYYQCYKCGTQYPTTRGYFQANSCYLYKGIGYLPYCRTCIDDIYGKYLAICKDTKRAVRQVCRKLDLVWNERAFDAVERQNADKSIIAAYITKINTVHYAGKSYDTTLSEEDMLWKWPNSGIGEESDDNNSESEIEITPPSEEVISFWGPGYTPEMYSELEARLQYYRSQMDDSIKQDLGTDALLRQIAMLEIDINKARANGSSVDKMVSTLNSLLSNLSKPIKKTEDINSSTANTPFGVWIKRWEDERPLPEIDESLKDVDGITKYVLTWVYGHIAHMLKVKNARTKLYDDAVAELRVERPEYDDEDDESMLEDIFGGSGNDADESSG